LGSRVRWFIMHHFSHWWERGVVVGRCGEGAAPRSVEPPLEDSNAGWLSPRSPRPRARRDRPVALSWYGSYRAVILSVPSGSTTSTATTPSWRPAPQGGRAPQLSLLVACKSAGHA